MSLTFPTRASGGNRGAGAIPGTPTRARHCRCPQPAIDRDTELCVFCGRYPKHVISNTWQHRAWTLALRAEVRRKPKK